jgi:ABC-2 type transport system ATP-binding protein
MDLALETRSLRKAFGTFFAVDGIDLAVPSGSFYGFLGPNGAGKSTTIKCLTGLLHPTSGDIRILGTDPIADPVAVKRRIGVVPEDLALFDRLSGAETLVFVGRVHGIEAEAVRSRAGELLALMSLADWSPPSPTCRSCGRSATATRRCRCSPGTACSTFCSTRTMNGPAAATSRGSPS